VPCAALALLGAALVFVLLAAARCASRPPTPPAVWSGAGAMAPRVGLPARRGPVDRRQTHRAASPAPRSIRGCPTAQRDPDHGGHAARRWAAGIRLRRDPTPALDALALGSAVFEHAFSQASWTALRRALLTGLYPSTHQAIRKADLLPEAVTTLPEAMRAAGWRTGGIVTNINLAPSFQFDQGYDEYLYLAPDYFFGASESSSKLAAYSGLRLFRERFLSKRKDVRHYYQDAATATAAATTGSAQRKGRFFLLLHYMDPHDPYFPHPYDGHAIARVDTPRPDPARAKELSDLYDGEIVFLDRHLGEFLDHLKARGLYDDALSCSRGSREEFHEHGGWWHGTTLYDEQIRIRSS
jgi:arylsulfatase A-like enzyme